MDRPVRLLLALAGSSVLALAACSPGGDGAAAPERTTATAAERTTAATPTAPVGAVPVRLQSEGGLDWRIAVVPDSETALVARAVGNFLQTRQSTIYEVTLQADGSWGNPVEPSFVTDETADTDPFVTADGSRVWFSSIRAVDDVFRPDFEIWYVDRQADGSWAEPVGLAAVNTANDEYHPSFSPDGETLYFIRRGALLEIPVAATELVG